MDGISQYGWEKFNRTTLQINSQKHFDIRTYLHNSAIFHINKINPSQSEIIIVTINYLSSNLTISPEEVIFLEGFFH